MSRPLTFLLVDDDEDGRFLIRRDLRKAFPDCELIECSNAEEALQAMGRDVDAVVTDNQLPEDSGVELIQEMRRRNVVCPIILVTGSVDPKVEATAYAAGATKVFAAGRAGFAELLRTSVRPDDPTPSTSVRTKPE